MIKIIIYDFDGTIADSMHLAIEEYNTIAKKEGFKYITESNLQILRRKSPREVLKELGINFFQAPKLAYRLLTGAKNRVAVLKPHLGMKELLFKAHELGYKQAILTTNLEYSVKGFLKNNQINKLDYIYCGSGIFGKARLLKKLLKTSGFDSNEAVYVGDEIRDIEAANKANVKSICVDWGYNAREALVKYSSVTMVSKPEEIITIIAQLGS